MTQNLRPNKFIVGCYIMVAIFTLSCKKEVSLKLVQVKTASLQVDENTATNDSINAFIDPYKKAIDSAMDSVLAISPKTHTKKDAPYNTAIGNLMADAVFELANPIFEKRTGYPFHAVLLNHGGIRAPLNEGPVTTRTAYSIMPFENEVVVVELSGLQIKELFKYLENGKRAHPIAGMTITLNADGTLKEGTIKGKPILDNSTYFIATSDYLQNGGDRMTFLTKPISKMRLDYKIRNVLIDYFKKYDTIDPRPDNRFTKEAL